MKEEIVYREININEKDIIDFFEMMLFFRNGDNAWTSPERKAIADSAIKQILSPKADQPILIKLSFIYK
jgi:hypothetical protein